MKKRILLSTLLFAVMLVLVFVFSACGEMTSKLVDNSYAFNKIEELDKDGVSRRSRLLEKYEEYYYIELLITEYDENEEISKETTLYLNNDIDSGHVLFYAETREYIKGDDGQTVVSVLYELVKLMGPGEEMYFRSTKLGDADIEKDAPVFLENGSLRATFSEFYKQYYDPAYLPQSEEVIIEAYKKLVSVNVNELLSLEIFFSGEYEGQSTINCVTFNYTTDKIHFVKNYIEEEESLRLLREIEYTYPGNLVTQHKEVDYSLFNMEHVCEPAAAVEENRVESTCLKKGSYDSVVYCSNPGCAKELSRTTVELELANCVDSDFNNVCDICYKGSAVTIGDTHYANLESAIEAAKPTDVIVLADNIDIQASVIINKEITLDLNGKTISAKNLRFGDGVFHVISGGKLTITGDGVVDGRSTHPDSDDYHMALWADGGEIVIMGGTFTNIPKTVSDQDDLIYVSNSGKITIKAGTFICATPKWTLNKNDSTGGEILVMGGVFHSYNPAASDTENPIANFVPDGYISVSAVVDGVTIWKVASFDSI